jgi:hypothetical protein
MRPALEFEDLVKPMSYKALFAIGAALDLEIEQMDVKTAFLYGEKEVCQGLVPDPRGLLQAIEGLSKLADPWRAVRHVVGLFDVDLVVDISVQECGFDIHLFNLQVQGRSDGEESASFERPSMA